MALERVVGMVEGRTMLFVKGSVGVVGVGVVVLAVRLVALLGRSQAVYSPISFPHLGQTELKDTHLVCINLKLDSQHRSGNVVHQIRRTHLPASTAKAKAPASIRIVLISDRIRSCIDDSPQVDKVLDGGCGDGNGSEGDASNEHGGDQEVDLGMR